MSKLTAVAILCALIPGGAAFASLQADGTIQPISSPTDTSFQYDITLHNTGTTNVGSFWFAWVPGLDFLPSEPMNLSAPAGWSANLIAPSFSGDGYSIQWVANSSAAAIAPGASLPGFNFTSLDDPSLMADYSPVLGGYYLTNTSYVYIGQPEFDPGAVLFPTVLSTVAAPEPATLSLAAFAILPLLKRRRTSGR